MDNPTAPTELSNEEDNDIWAIEFSSNGSMMATGDINGIVVIWDVMSSPPVRVITLTGQSERIFDLAFSDDDKLMASASWDRSVQIWETNALSKQPVRLKDHTYWVNAVAFNPNGEEVITACADNVIRKYTTDPNELAKQMCDKISRNMSQYEWNRYVAEDIDYEKTCEELPPGEGIENYKE